MKITINNQEKEISNKDLRIGDFFAVLTGDFFASLTKELTIKKSPIVYFKDSSRIFCFNNKCFYTLKQFDGLPLIRLNPTKMIFDIMD